MHMSEVPIKGGGGVNGRCSSNYCKPHSKSCSQVLTKPEWRRLGRQRFFHFSDRYLCQGSTAPKLRYHHHSRVVEGGGLKGNDGQHQLATFCLHANCLQDPASFMSRYNFLPSCCTQTSSSFKSLGTGAYEKSKRAAHIPLILTFCSEDLFPFHLTSDGGTVCTHPTHHLATHS